MSGLDDLERRRSWDAPSIYGPSGSSVRLDLGDALDIDGRVALRGVRRLLVDDLPWLEKRAVRLARRQGLGWGAIARLLGRRRQSVWARYRELDTSSMPLPMPSTSATERNVSRLRVSAADARRRREFESLGPHDATPW